MIRHYTLGISAYYHDSAAALLCAGEIVAAAQEERFSRLKGDASFPARAVEFCLETAGIDAADVDTLVFYENPYSKFERLLSIAHQVAP
ncbi:MAG: carbamoyltransferase N-terminal domain-containing protein, partial [Pseudomonadota bacterium]